MNTVTERKDVRRFDDLVGTVLSMVRMVSDDRIEFHLEDGRSFVLYHSQDCCEHVTINDVAGDINDLVGRVVSADESSNTTDPPPSDGYDDSHTWTFYRIATANGLVVIRWFGSSNGYYSEAVSFESLS